MGHRSRPVLAGRQLWGGCAAGLILAGPFIHVQLPAHLFHLAAHAGHFVLHCFDLVGQLQAGLAFWSVICFICWRIQEWRGVLRRRRRPSAGMANKAESNDRAVPTGRCARVGNKRSFSFRSNKNAAAECRHGVTVKVSDINADTRYLHDGFQRSRLRCCPRLWAFLYRS